MRIITLIAENVKKLRAVEISPTGNVVQITGPNGSGKSSVLDAIFYALAGTKGIDSKPIRDGEKKAHVTIDLGEFVVSRRFHEAGGSSLTVEANGAVFKSPQAMLDKLIGPLAFDPLAFAQATAKDQLDELRQLVPLEIDIDALDFDNRRDFDARTNLNREIKQLEAQFAQYENLESVEKPADVGTLLTELEASVERNRTIDIEARRRADFYQSIAYKEQKLAKLRDEVHEIEIDISIMRDEVAMWPVEETVAEVADLRTQIDEATECQRMYENNRRRWADRERILASLTTARDASANLTLAMEQRVAERTAAIAAAKMPVDGLSFGEGEVFFNGIPFSQASSAEQLRVSVAIAMAGNPKLRVLRIKDGSLLDSKSLALIAEMADTNDFQVWVEKVDETGKVGIVMEDGAVASVAK